MEDEYNPLILALSALRVPVVVGINGACAGAGLGIALAGDLRVAAAGAKFTTAFAGVGLSSDSALASRLVHCVGGSRATELLLTPDPFTAETAEQWGLVHRVVPAEEVLAEAQALAARLAAGPTAAYRAMKTVLATAATDSLEETLALEARLQARAGPDGRPPRGGRGVPGEAGTATSPAAEAGPRGRRVHLRVGASSPTRRQGVSG